MKPTDVLTFEPEHYIFLDWETYYDDEYSLFKMSTEAYVRDSRFEGLGVGVDDGEEYQWMEEWEFREWAKTVPWEKCAVGAHHHHFDGLINSHHYGIVPGFYFCSLSMARAIHGVGGLGLKDLLPKYGLGEKGHEVDDAKGKHRKDFTQLEWEQYGEYCRKDTQGCKGLCYAMSEKLPESELWVIDSTVRMFTQPVFVLDEPFLQQYAVDEKARKQAFLERLTDGDTKALRSILMSSDKLARLFVKLGEEPPMKVSPKTGKDIPAFAKNDPGMQDLLEHSDDTIRWVAEARVAVKSTINETRTERFLKMGKGGRAMPVYLKYYGAHTGRWSGADGVNWQNLERTDKKKPEKGALRKAVLAPQGMDIVVADSSQIEARTTAWLAGHNTLLEAFAAKRDIYSEFASEIYGRPVDRKKNPDDFIPGFIAKCSVLGLGYQMGWYTFAATLLKGMLGGPPVQFKEEDAANLGVDADKFISGKYGQKKLARIEKMPSRIDLDARVLHCAVAERIVYTYRDANKPVQTLWKVMEEAIAAMAEGDECTFGPGGCLQTVRHGIVLPNGMTLYYPGLERRDEDDEEGGYTYLGPFRQRKKAYGGSVTENVVQALARVIVSDQMLMVRGKFGYQAATTTHDEIVCVAPQEESANALHALLQEMKTPPDWAPGLPLDAEGGRAKSYGGSKA